MVRSGIYTKGNTDEETICISFSGVVRERVLVWDVVAGIGWLLEAGIVFWPERVVARDSSGVAWDVVVSFGGLRVAVEAERDFSVI